MHSFGVTTKILLVVSVHAYLLLRSTLSWLAVFPSTIMTGVDPVNVIVLFPCR